MWRTNEGLTKLLDWFPSTICPQYREMFFWTNLLKQGSDRCIQNFVLRTSSISQNMHYLVPWWVISKSKTTAGVWKSTPFEKLRMSSKQTSEYTLYRLESCFSEIMMLWPFSCGQFDNLWEYNEISTISSINFCMYWYAYHDKKHA